MLLKKLTTERIKMDLKTITYEYPQRSTDWINVRMGCVTGSGVTNVFAKTKTGESEAKKKYKTKLIVERLTNESQDNDFVSTAMLWGIEKEEMARVAYQEQNEVFVKQEGFIKIENEFIGYSPDGLVSENGLIEIKCPSSAKHFEYLDSEEIPNEYINQMILGMIVTNRSWCDFISYDPRFTKSMQLFVKRIFAKDYDTEGFLKSVREFNNEVEQSIRKHIF
jgi:putative phage-type endonuclease